MRLLVAPRISEGFRWVIARTLEDLRLGLKLST